MLFRQLMQVGHQNFHSNVLLLLFLMMRTTLISCPRPNIARHLPEYLLVPPQMGRLETGRMLTKKYIIFCILLKVPVTLPIILSFPTLGLDKLLKPCRFLSLDLPLSRAINLANGRRASRHGIIIECRNGSLFEEKFLMDLRSLLLQFIRFSPALKHILLDWK